MKSINQQKNSNELNSNFLLSSISKVQHVIMKDSMSRIFSQFRWVMLPTYFIAIGMFLSSQIIAGSLMDKVPESEPANFTLMSSLGSDISLSDYKGRFVLLNFWATWCPPCVKEMPALNLLHNKLSGDNGLQVVGVHVGPALATVKQFLKERPVDFDIVIDKNMALSGWEVSGLPTTFLISPSGKIIYKAVGEREWDSEEMVKFLQGVMKEYERLAVLDNLSTNS